MERRDFTFLNLGGLGHYVISDGRVVGTLYFEPGDYSDEYCWRFAPVECPLERVWLKTPPLLPDMTVEQIEASTDIAMDELCRQLTLSAA